jgi:hypothetical protein
MIVRLAAIISLAGLLSGYKSESLAIKLLEIVMLALWAQMEYSKYKTYAEHNKSKKN